jgi:hypothetical protein
MADEGKRNEEDRVRAVLRRLLTEIFWIRTHTSALRGLGGVEAEGLDFFRVARNALIGDRNVRLLRGIDGHMDARPLGYLRNCRPQLFDRNLNLGSVEAMQERLKEVRDRVLAHIDRRAAGMAARIYDEAGVEMAEINEFIEELWNGLRAMHEEIFDVAFRFVEFDEAEPRRLAQLRDDAIKR